MAVRHEPGSEGKERKHRVGPKALLEDPGAAELLRACRRLQEIWGLDGLIYRSARHRGGTCVARFLPRGLVLATRPLGSVRFHWNGKKLARTGIPD
jgi:hypothetical protein